MNHRWTYRLGYKPTIQAKLVYNLNCELGTGYFTRTSAATCTDYLGNLITCDVNEPRFDGGRRISEGVWSNVKPDGSPIVPTPKLLMEGASTNKTTAKTANPVDLTGVIKSGDSNSILSIVDDSSELALSGLSNICTGNVYKLDNSGGTTNAYCTLAGKAGNTNKHTVSFYARGTLLAPRLEAVSTGNIVSPSTYTRVQHSGNPRPSYRAVVQVLPGGVAYFILPQLEESPVCTSVIPNDTGSAVTRTADALSWPLSAELQAMLADAGTLVLDWTPGCIPPASQIGIVSCNAAVDSLLSVAAGGSVTRATNGVTPITGGATLVTNTQIKLILRWSAASGKYQLSSIASGVITHGTEGNFDGAFTLGSNLLLHYSNAYPAKYSGLKLFKRYLTDNEIMRLQ